MSYARVSGGDHESRVYKIPWFCTVFGITTTCVFAVIAPNSRRVTFKIFHAPPAAACAVCVDQIFMDSHEPHDLKY